MLLKYLKNNLQVYVYKLYFENPLRDKNIGDHIVPEVFTSNPM